MSVKFWWGQNNWNFTFLRGSWGLISIFGPVSLKSKISHKFSSLNHLMLNETVLEMSYCQLNVGKNRLEVMPFWGALELISIFGPTGLKQKKCYKLRYYGLLGVLKTLLTFSYLVGKCYDKKPNVSWLKTFCKVFICAYWVKNVTILTIWVFMLFTVVSISSYLQSVYIFLKRFLLELFIMLHVTFLISGIKFCNL